MYLSGVKEPLWERVSVSRCAVLSIGRTLLPPVRSLLLLTKAVLALLFSVVVKRNFLEAKPLLTLLNGKNTLRKLNDVETLLRGRLARRRLLAKLKSASEPVVIGGKSSKQTWK